MSFLGAVSTDGEAVARVRITTGNTALGPTDSNGGVVDVVVMDDFIYSEPVLDLGPTTIETVASFVAGLPGRAFKARGHQRAILSHLVDIQNEIDSEEIEEAVSKLEALRRKLDGCNGSNWQRADAGDWVINCDAQRELRGLVDDLLTLL